jgi:probable biosynthetic protein (TIGR04098 family)
MKKTRHYELGMPALSYLGLSEAWLCRELGDLHWNLICDGLNTVSSRLEDSIGNRLYATFTRLQYSIEPGLGGFKENDRLILDADISRYGASLFFSEAKGTSDSDTSGKATHATATITAALMSTFSSREGHDNKTLARGEPILPPGFSIPEHTTMPEFGQVYRKHRGFIWTDPIFEAEYELNPFYDINGVSLVYFAAYPLIADICELRFTKTAYAERGIDALAMSTIERDVFYFANCDANDAIVYRLHEVALTDIGYTATATLTRASDGKLMAELRTRKVLQF